MATRHKARFKTGDRMAFRRFHFITCKLQEQLSYLSKIKRLTSLFASNASGTIIGNIAQLAAIPLQLKYLGAEQFGLLVLFNSFIMAGSMTDAGIGPTTLRFVAKNSHRRRAVEHVVASALTVLTLVFLSLSILVLLATLIYTSLTDHTVIANSIKTTTYVMLVLMAIGASMCGSLALNIFKGLRRYKTFALIESTHRIALPLIATSAAIMTGQTLWVLVASCTWMAVSAGLVFWLAVNAAAISIRFTTRLQYFRRRMLSFSSWIWIQAIFAYLGTQADRLIIASVMNLSVLAAYSIAMSISNALLAVISSGSSFLIPEATTRVNDAKWLKKNFQNLTLLFSAVSALAIVILLPFSHYLLTAWLGNKSALAVLPIILPLLWTVSNAASSIPGNSIIMAMGHSKFAALAGAVGNSVVLVAMVAGGTAFGIYGVLAGKLCSIFAGFLIRASIAKTIFGMPNAYRTALSMVWPTLLGCLVVLPISWHYLAPK